jgi:hypothetical protein
MTAPNHDESKPRRRWPTYLAVTLVLMLVFYPLSLGPTAVIARHWRNETFITAAELFYLPLLVTSKKTGTEEILAVYAEWCCDLTNAPPMN